ncbi:MAG: thioredoxin domain-containing protein [Gammaproteobacteria bacterium]|nr:thioredoxin domain-containing protein [Gammaproteobacteria bacterium]
MNMCTRAWLIALTLLMPPAQALENQLREHPSPYLAMHGTDPVAWQDWGPAAVDAAREQGKLLFVSSGYFSCHWCHVMQRESYRNADIAAFLNRHFIPVKLDRELHGALDSHLIGFLEKTQGHAGWPLNVFLTPEGYPLIGATYLPPEQFLQLVQRLQQRWEDDRGQLRNLARRTMLQLALQRAAADVEPMSAVALDTALLQEAVSLADVMQGGFGEESRFPMAPQLLALLELQVRRPPPGLGEFLLLTLDKIAREGMRDHLAGGFFRYTVDPSWEIPHFEKMLYTQALLAEVYMRAADVFGRPDYDRVAFDTLRFVDREMRSGQGGYIASFSAVDSAGEEGAAYLWSVDELHALLGEEDTALARRHWRMQGVPAFLGLHLPMQGEPAHVIAQQLELAEADVAARLEDIRRRLLVVRQRRDLPADDKILAGWNGLMLAAFTKGALRWEDTGFRDAAGRIRSLLVERLWDGQRLRRALRGDQELGKVTLEDYAYVAYGMNVYAALSGNPGDRTFAAALLSQAWQRFYDGSGWMLDDKPLIPGLGAEAAITEGALPSPSAVLVRLSLASDSAALRAKGVAAAQQGRANAQAEPFWYSGHHAALLEITPSESAERQP